MHNLKVEALVQGLHRLLLLDAADDMELRRLEGLPPQLRQVFDCMVNGLSQLAVGNDGLQSNLDAEDLGCLRCGLARRARPARGPVGPV